MAARKVRSKLVLMTAGERLVSADWAYSRALAATNTHRCLFVQSKLTTIVRAMSTGRRTLARAMVAVLLGITCQVAHASMPARYNTTVAPLT